jgi:hypothetical protein
MADLAPHPLVLAIGYGLSNHGDQALQDAVDALDNALKDAVKGRWGSLTREELKKNLDARGLSKTGVKDVLVARLADDDVAQKENVAPTAAVHDDSVAPEEKNAVAKQLGQQLVLRDLTLLGGYLGPNLEYDDEEWRQLYLDERLQRWLCTPRDTIVDERRQDDEMAAFGKRDAMWVKADARVVHGRGPQPLQRRFLVGDITRAADVDPAPAGGTGAPVTGLFCEARTPGCCYGARSRPG